MKRIAILVDSAADISNEEAKVLGVHVIRMPLTIGAGTKMECDEITEQEFLDEMSRGTKVKTSQPILGDLMNKWDELLKEYEQVLYIPISEGLSGTYSSAVTASEDYKGKVFVARSEIVAYPIQYIAQKAVEMVEAGLDIEKIKEVVERPHGMYAVIVPETLTHLKNGGRISPAAAALGNLLKIIPLLKFDSGKIDALDKVRTTKKAYLKAAEYVSGDIQNKEDYLWYIVHSGCEERAIEFSKVVQEKYGLQTDIRPLRAIITAHTGPGTLAIGRIQKINY